MKTTLNTLALAAVAALLMTAPAVAADDPQAESDQAAPCEAFYYGLDPPGYKFDPSCIGSVTTVTTGPLPDIGALTGPLPDNSP